MSSGFPPVDRPNLLSDNTNIHRVRESPLVVRPPLLEGTQDLGDHPNFLRLFALPRCFGIEQAVAYKGPAGLADTASVYQRLGLAEEAVSCFFLCLFPAAPAFAFPSARHFLRGV